MGFMRKALFVSTGGLSGVAVKANSKKERTAKAAEKQVRLQQQTLRVQRRAIPDSLPRSPAPPVGLDSPGRLARATRREAREGPAREFHRAADAADAARAQALTAGATPEEAQAEAAYAAVAHATGRFHALDAQRTEQSAEVGVASELEQLAALHASGALTDAEFAAAKAKVLSS